MSALRAYPDIRYTPHRRAGERLPSKPPKLSVIQGQKGERVSAVKSELKKQSAFTFFVLCAGSLILSLVLVLVLRIHIIASAMELSDIDKQIRVVQQDIQVKTEMLQRNQADLPQKAEELGLVRAANPKPLNVTPFIAEVTGGMVGGVTVRSGE